MEFLLELVGKSTPEGVGYLFQYILPWSEILEQKCSLIITGEAANFYYTALYISQNRIIHN
jgi:hypothetical protein